MPLRIRIWLGLLVFFCSSNSFAQCQVDASYRDINFLERTLAERHANLATVAKSYMGATGSREGWWVDSLAAVVASARSDVVNLRNIVWIRDKITGSENKILVDLMLRHVLIDISRGAYIAKDHLISASTMTNNQLVVAELTRLVPTLETIEKLGRDCQLEAQPLP